MTPSSFRTPTLHPLPSKGSVSTDTHPTPVKENFPFLSVSKGRDFCWDIPHMPGRPLECQLDHRLPTTSPGQSRGHCVGSPARRFRFVACASPCPPRHPAPGILSCRGRCHFLTFVWQMDLLAGPRAPGGHTHSIPSHKAHPLESREVPHVRSFNRLETQGLTRWLVDLAKSLNFSEPQFSLGVPGGMEFRHCPRPPSGPMPVPRKTFLRPTT